MLRLKKRVKCIIKRHRQCSFKTTKLYLFSLLTLNRTVSTLALVCTGVGLLSCEKDANENLSAPTIQAFYNTADTVGAEVRIVGTQFSQKPTNNKVSFNGQEASAFALRGDTLKVHVPQGAKTGPLTLRVFNQSVVSTGSFTVLIGHWRYRGSLPATHAAVNGFAVNGKAYLYIQGSPVGFTSYDARSNTWMRLADFPGGVRGGMLSFSIGGRGYMGAGVSDNALRQHADCYAYDPAVNQWTQVASFPGGNLDTRYTIAFAAGGKGYIVCTNWYNGRRPVWEYDPKTNVWSPKSDFPGVDRYLAGGMAIGDKGYVGGGTTGGSPLLQDFWEFDPIANTWTRKADLPAATESPVSFSLGNKGYWGLKYSSDFSEYDPATNTWAPADYPATSVFLGTSFTTGEKGYLVVPDVRGTSFIKSDLWEFTP